MRRAEISRDTKETRIRLAIDLDGNGESSVDTGIGFMDHMLTHLARHGLFNLEVNAKGDLNIDAHHTVEDIGICLGQAFTQALGRPEGIRRFGHAVVPMDEALAEVAVDISGRPFLSFQAELPHASVGEFDAELTEEFFRAFAMNSRITLHILLRQGSNLHHSIEAIFKAWARALACAVQKDSRVQGVPSTKGILET